MARSRRRRGQARFAGVGDQLQQDVDLGCDVALIARPHEAQLGAGASRAANANAAETASPSAPSDGLRVHEEGKLARELAVDQLDRKQLGVLAEVLQALGDHRDLARRGDPLESDRYGQAQALDARRAKLGTARRKRRSETLEVAERANHTDHREAQARAARCRSASADPSRSRSRRS